jgi:hemoglobin
MKPQSIVPGPAGSPVPRSYGLPVTEGAGVPHADAEGITEDLIGDVVVEFYRRARRDERLGPVFEGQVHEWDGHLARMADFWSAALLRTGRYSGRPVERHRSIEGLAGAHFDRWVALFEATVRDLCSPREAEAFLIRARRMREGMTKVLGLDGGVPTRGEYPEVMKGDIDAARLHHQGKD